MKKISIVLLSFLAVSALYAQTDHVTVDSNEAKAVQVQPVKTPALDKSPMDMSYFPADYPILKTQNKATTPPVMRVVYSRPLRGDRAIFGELIEYNKVWRLGANEATEIEFFREVAIRGKKIPKGRYTLYAIPTESSWTMILNSDTDSWGAFVYDATKDLVRTEVPIEKLATPVEPFSMMFVKTAKGANLVVSWEHVSASLPIEFK